MLTLENFQSHKNKIAICGLGYVGLPLAVELGKLYDVIGFDVSKSKINALKEGVDETNELNREAINNANIDFTDSSADLQKASIIIVTVPTPINVHNTPDLTIIKAATKTIGENLQKGSIVVYESTVYPGLTEDICIPILEKTSGLKFGDSFTVGYSPERLSPGDSNAALTKIIKVVSGSDQKTLTLLSHLYGSIVPAGIHEAPSIKVAEAAKVIENTQRDLNVALMNELSKIFNKMGINTMDVINAAATKWNFMKMTPGLVGGHCIGVDPYYLTHKAEEIGYSPEVILSGRRINDSMGKYVAENTIKQLIKADKKIKGANVLILGVSFKENVSDIRNSKVFDLIHELEDYGINITAVDPVVNPKETLSHYNIKVLNQLSNGSFDACILAVNHTAFSDKYLLEEIFPQLTTPSIFIDIKNSAQQNQQLLRNITYYWSL